jgi:polysaccharide deacetylase 2 family uncharacterized protein YibQ
MKSDSSSRGRRENDQASRLYWGFILLAFLACLGLDFLAARRGEKAYLFASRPSVVTVGAASRAWTEIILRRLGESGIPAEDIQETTDESGTPSLVVSLPPEVYAQIEPELERELREKKTFVRKKERIEAEKIAHIWQIEGGEDEKLSLLFSCARPVPEKKEEVIPPPAGNLVAIIIDDMGNSLEVLQEILDLNTPLTISVLPYSRYAEETARLAHDNGLEVMLHLPGESLNHLEGNNNTEGIILSGMKEGEIRASVEDSLARVPFAKGVNNHMGSKITQEELSMRPILDLLKERDLFFLDSRTTSQSIAYDLAMKMGLRSAYRNVFLDSTVGVDFSKQKMIELFRLSQKKGSSVGIGHPFPETLQALKENIHLLEKYDVRPVFASQVVRK